MCRSLEESADEERFKCEAVRSPTSVKRHPPAFNQGENKQADIKRVPKSDIKIKKKTVKTVGLSDEVIHSRLQNVDLQPIPIALDKLTMDVTVSRAFMSATYGGNTRYTFPKISRKFFEKHGMADFIYINMDYNPHAPQVPGAPGLKFSRDGFQATGQT
ncbi:hypothetical protein D9758_004624 [Tetrapyrgos nigripes]|uniref:DUF6697 domain-containing protein n=1 Tax=Tetrapyrgos nigripes TaxID=182062 RepID=A0A8H5GZZ4_9AGAR|nr:hypothetical protein D9758_004624 [Tetrapyrgos nigripes]